MLYDYLVQDNKAAFLAKVNDIAGRLGISADSLMFVMKTESNIDPAAVNPYSGATGLIQFMPATASGLGTSTGALRSMSNVQQLDYVYRYFKPFTGKLNTVTDLYMATFFPKALGQPDNFVMQTDTLTAAKIAGQNPIFDLDKNGQITAGEFRNAVVKRYPGILSENLERAADFVKKK